MHLPKMLVFIVFLRHSYRVMGVGGYHSVN